MRFKSFRSITLGKQKKTDEDEDKFKDIASDRIANMEKKIQGRTKDLEEKAQQIQELSPKSEKPESNVDVPKGPHGPLSELTLESDEQSDDEIKLTDLGEVDKDEDDSEEGIKLVEVSTASVIPEEIKEEAEENTTAEASAVPTDSKEKEEESGEAKPAEAGDTPTDSKEKEGEIKLDDSSDSLNNLFSDEEEEENPLANLIKSLPDVTAQEIMDDINEIKGIIREWQKK